MDIQVINQELKKFNVTDAAIAEMKSKYMPLTINGIEDKAGYATVKEGRQFMKGLRVNVDKKRKELNEGALTFQRAINAEAKRITADLEPIEEHLLAQEKAIDDERECLRVEAEQKRQEALQARIDAFAAVNKRVEVASLFNMTEEAFQEGLAAATAEYEVEQAALKEAEEKRLEAEKIEREAEAARAAEAEKARLAEQEAFRIAKEAQDKRQAELDEITRQQAEEARVLKEEREKLERQMQHERNKKEAAQKANADAELKAKRDAQRKIDEERKVKEDAEYQARLRPDMEKIQQLLKALRSLPIELPENYKTEKARKAVDEAFQYVLKANSILEEFSEGEMAL
jgi:fused signal recognition particle receptor